MPAFIGPGNEFTMHLAGESFGVRCVDKIGACLVLVRTAWPHAVVWAWEPYCIRLVERQHAGVSGRLRPALQG